MADITLTARQNEIWLAESPLTLVEGEAHKFTVTVPYATTVSSPNTTAYLKGTDVSAAVLTAGDNSSGNVITTDKFTPSADIRGPYIITVAFTNSTQSEVKKIKIHVSLKEDES